MTGGDPGAGAHGLLHLQTRRSMVFAKHLRAVGDEFRSRYLNSTDAADRIPFEEDWTKMKVDPTSVILGGGMHFVSRCLTANPLLQERAEREHPCLSQGCRAALPQVPEMPLVSREPPSWCRRRDVGQ